MEDIILYRWWKIQTVPTSLIKRDFKDLVKDLLEIRRKLDQSCRTTEVALAKGSCFSNWRKHSIESEEDDDDHMDHDVSMEDLSKDMSANPLQPRGTENNENRGGSASGNPMLATPNPRSNCGGEDGSKRSNCRGEDFSIKRAAVDAEKQVNRGGSASGNPMLATPNPEPNSSKQTNPQSRISTVLFVEQTRRGGLAAKMRETISRLEPMLGFRWKVVENAGTNLASIMGWWNLWEEGLCPMQTEE